MAKIRQHLISLLGCVATLAIPLVILSFPAFAGQFNELRSIGDVAPIWSDLPGVDGKSYSLGDFTDKEVLVVAFTCNSCSYANEYEDRLLALSSKYIAQDSRVALVAVNVNKIEADLLPAMKKRAEERKYTFPYLFDETQKIATELGAARTPEFFVLDQERKIVYMGALDDNTDSSKVTVRYVEDAIEALLKAEKVQIQETPPVGCRIRYGDARRNRQSKD